MLPASSHHNGDLWLGREVFELRLEDLLPVHVPAPAKRLFELSLDIEAGGLREPLIIVCATLEDIMDVYGPVRGRLCEARSKSRAMYIINGSQRYHIYGALGEKTIPCVFVNSMRVAQELEKQACIASDPRIH